MPSGGLFCRKERLAPTLRGWLVLTLTACVVLILAVLGAHPFFAISEPVAGEILVVEGWVPDYTLVKAMQEFRSSGYRYIVTTGEPLTRGSYLQEHKSFAELAAATLAQLGVGPDSLVAVPAPRMRVNRTSSSAVAFAAWLKQAHPGVNAVNVITLGVHARRTRLLFQRAVGDAVRVGVLSVEDENFDPLMWWTSSSGFQSVLEEVVGYGYAFF